MPGRLPSLAPHESVFVLLTRTFHTSRSYHPSYSLLGRLVRAATGDRLRTEALFVVILTGLVLLLLLTHYLGWAMLQPVFTGPDGTDWQITFWIGQVASVLTLGLLAGIGFRPGLTVECGPDAVHLSQGRQTLSLPYSAIGETALISARQFHRHYRLYAATRIFAGTIRAEVLLLRTDNGPVVVALDRLDDQVALRGLLTERTEEPAPVLEED